MKQILLALTVLVSSSAFAADIELINCEGVKKANMDYVSTLYLNVNKLKVNSAVATIDSYTLTIVNKGEKYEGFIPNVTSGTFTNNKLTNEAYKGTKYVNHLKFKLTGKGMQSLGEQSLDYAALIIDPEYTVKKTIHEENYSDPSWNWDIEIRQHSAVLSLNFDDHHGDYIKLNCYSTAHVNDSKTKP